MSVSVLLVEDDELLREGLATLFESKGHTVFTAQDGEEGLRLAHERRPDVIVSNLNMPRMDGLTLLSALRGDHMAHVPFVLISADARHVRKVEATGHDPDAFFAKPFDAEAVVEEAVTLAQKRKGSLDGSPSS